MYKIILQDYLNEHNKSQYWLSKQTGMTPTALSRICTGEATGVRLDSLYKICKALRCTPNDLLLDDDGKPLSNHISQQPGKIDWDITIQKTSDFNPLKQNAHLEKWIDEYVNRIIDKRLAKPKSDDTK